MGHKRDSMAGEGYPPRAARSPAGASPAKVPRGARAIAQDLQNDGARLRSSSQLAVGKTPRPGRTAPSAPRAGILRGILRRSAPMPATGREASGGDLGAPGPRRRSPNPAGAAGGTFCGVLRAWPSPRRAFT